MAQLSVLELCAGGGGQALGLEAAGFQVAAAFDNDPDACDTLNLNRPTWQAEAKDIRKISGRSFGGVDLVAGGVPCPPFSIAGLQQGRLDNRDLFPAALDIIDEARPRAVMLENVRGFVSSRFHPYRVRLIGTLAMMGYTVPEPRLLNAADYGVPQLRPRFVLVAFRDAEAAARYTWPNKNGVAPTVGRALGALMGRRGWPGVESWIARANGIAPTLVGGSKKHGGPDLGPTRAKREWAKLGVDGLGLADQPPGPELPEDHTPRLTMEMAACVQGFPPAPLWVFSGKKTSAYRQVGNAFPPPVAEAVGRSVLNALNGDSNLLCQQTGTEKEMVLA